MKKKKMKLRNTINTAVEKFLQGIRQQVLSLKNKCLIIAFPDIPCMSPYSSFCNPVWKLLPSVRLPRISCLQFMFSS